MTAAPKEVFDTSTIGSWGDPLESEVTSDQIAAYAAASNDRHALHAAGRQAPIVFAVVPAFPLLAERCMAAAPPELMLRILHAEHRIVQHRALLPGDQLRMRSRVIGIKGTARGVAVVTETETARTADASVINRQYFTGHFRGGHHDGVAGETPRVKAVPDSLLSSTPDAVVHQRFDDDQTHRYAAASGDPMPIHTDDEFARSQGLPGIIVHGLCTMAFLSVGLVARQCADQPNRLSELGVRFSSPAFPGQQITTKQWNAGRAEQATTIALTTRGPSDEPIAHGQARVQHTRGAEQ